ncbi:stage V sporulation protein AD [Allofournierella sp.]|uniref:stage V sporulation protein AD n=1 Tax=Allofournierella sp. TaxID=1940256 RepID=UPI003AEF9B1C
MRKGDTILFETPPAIAEFAAVGGKREGEGPLAARFDLLFEENSLGQETWEQSESQLQRHCLDLALQKANLAAAQLDLILAGDLENQCTASAYTLREVDVPFTGLYGACSTMAEALGLAACLAAAGFVNHAAAMTSSHFCAAERQFRTPLVYGGKRAPTAQWTATAAGCCILAGKGQGPFVKSVTFGRVRDYEIKDINNMGAAMAPAAAETILRHCADTKRTPGDFDAVFTGDLGIVGTRLLKEILEKEGLKLDNHQDCGLLLYDIDSQDVQAGGSGAGCSASVLCAHVLPALRAGKLKKVLFLSTGALMSQITFLQGESIPGVAHLVELASEKEGQA